METMLGAVVKVVKHVLWFGPFLKNILQNILAWLVIVVTVVWWASKRLAPPGAPLPRIRERVASVLGLRMDPRHALWATVKENISTRELQLQYLLSWNLEDLRSGYVYLFPLPGRPKRVPHLLPIDPCRNSGKPELVFLTGKARSFKTKTVRAIAQALDERNLTVLASDNSNADVVHIKEFYAREGVSVHIRAEKLVRELAANARETRSVAGSLLFVVDVMTDWDEDDIVDFVRRILRNGRLYKAEEITIVLTLPEISPVVTSDDEEDERIVSLRSLQRIYERARRHLPGEPEGIEPDWDRWQVQFLSTIHLGADTIIERLAEKMFERLTTDRWFRMLQPVRRRLQRIPWKIGLQQALRDLAGRKYDSEGDLRKGPTSESDKDKDFYDQWARKILYNPPKWRFARLWRVKWLRRLFKLWKSSYYVIQQDGQSVEREEQVKEVVRSYLKELKRTAQTMGA